MADTSSRELARATLRRFLRPESPIPELQGPNQRLRLAFHHEGLWGILCQQQDWKEEYLQELGRQGRWLDLLHEIDQALARHGARAFVFKGGSAICGLYPGLGQRPLSDLDLWADDESVALILEQLGFRIVSQNPRVMARGPFRLDLHQHPLGRQGHAFGWNLQRARSQGIPLSPAAGIMRFSLEDETLIALLHAGKHGYSRSIWLADLGLLLDRCAPERLRPLLVEAGAQRYLSYARWMLCQEAQILAAEWAGPLRLNAWERWFLEGCCRRRPSWRAGMLLPLFSIRSPRRAFGYLWRALRPKARQSLWQRGLELLWAPAP